VKTDGRVPTFEEAKARFRASWEAFKLYDPERARTDDAILTSSRFGARRDVMKRLDPPRGAADCRWVQLFASITIRGIVGTGRRYFTSLRSPATIDLHQGLLWGRGQYK
jgi:hypothetical protein